ncbi:MAG: Holliday junction resolvase RecU [Bacillales bacterium]
MTNKQISTYGNRGMALESCINKTNLYYKEKNIALIYKKPTPIKVINTKNGRITRAFFLNKSTTDYNGVYKGYYLDFEAKSTRCKTSWSLNNIPKWQIDHFNKVLNQKGIPFIILDFVTLKKIYLLPFENLKDFIKNNNRKSIPVDYLNNNCYLINRNNDDILDFLNIIDNFYDSKNNTFLNNNLHI